MKKGEIKNRRGFTMIELMFVLAIAGLIFLMIFVALPALQRQARDTERKEDISFLISKLKEYQTNHRGALPTKSSSGWTSIKWPDDQNPNTAKEWDLFYRDYLGGENFVDPNGEQYWLVVGYCGSGAVGQNCSQSNSLAFNNVGPVGVTYPDSDSAVFPNKFAIFMTIGAKCSGEKTVRTKNIRKVAVSYKLEGGGSYCENT